MRGVALLRVGFGCFIVDKERLYEICLFYFSVVDKDLSNRGMNVHGSRQIFQSSYHSCDFLVFQCNILLRSKFSCRTYFECIIDKQFRDHCRKNNNIRVQLRGKSMFSVMLAIFIPYKNANTVFLICD